jgi:hypothetical protein
VGFTPTVSTPDQVDKPRQCGRHANHGYQSVAYTELFSMQARDISHRYRHRLVFRVAIERIMSKNSLCKDNLAAVVASRTQSEWHLFSCIWRGILIRMPAVAPAQADDEGERQRQGNLWRRDSNLLDGSGLTNANQRQTSCKTLCSLPPLGARSFKEFRPARVCRLHLRVRATDSLMTGRRRPPS